jgi:hypothetical protein
LILRVGNFVIRTKPEVFDKAMAAAHVVTALVVDRYVDKAALCLGRWAAERHFGSNLARPDRLDDRFENRQCDARSGLARAERTTLAIGVVVADPDGDGDIMVNPMNQPSTASSVVPVLPAT